MFAYDDLRYEELLDNPQPSCHFVQLFGTDRSVLATNVARYFREGLIRGETVLCVATPESELAIVRALKAELPSHAAAMRSPRISFLDAAQTLERFLVEAYPDSLRFDNVVGEAVRAAKARSATSGLRVYGEMVGTLWQSGDYPAAIRLEQLWSQLMKRTEFSLFCSYPVDIFDSKFGVGVADAMLCAHGQLLPTGVNGQVERAVSRAIDDVLGADSDVFKTSRGSKERPGWPMLPQGEATILWLRKHLAHRADEILTRAREYYQTAI